MSDNDRGLVEHALGLTWSLWAELGVSSWVRSHANWSVELEPLIAFTAFIVEHDRRLLRETVDWCVENVDLVSMHQLRHVVSAQRWPFRGEIGRFGATVSERSRRTWPGSKDERPYDIESSGKSALGDLRSPSLLQLRLRLIFGVSGRAEIVRMLVSDPISEWSVARMSSRVPYTRRQVASDLEALRLGGLIRRTQRSGGAAYSLRMPEVVLEVVGERPAVYPRWAPVFRVLTALLETDEKLSRRAMPASEIVRQLRHVERALEESGLQEPPLGHGPIDVEAVLHWMRELFASLASGDPSFLPPEDLAPSTFGDPS